MLGTISAFDYRHRETKKNLCRDVEISAYQRYICLPHAMTLMICYNGDRISLWRLVFAESGYTGDIGNTGTGLPPRRAAFHPRAVNVGIVVGKVSLGFLSPSRHVPWQYLRLYHKSCLPHLTSRHHASYILDRRTATPQIGTMHPIYRTDVPLLPR